MNTIKNLRKELQKLLTTRASYRRTIKIAAVISSALKSIDIEPILVGGSAVEIYSRGGYATQDIDMVCPGGKDLQQVMESLGFERLGKDYVISKYGLYVEFPSSALGLNESFQTFKIDQHQIKIVSIEDLIVDRLCAFKFWASAIDGLNAILLFESNTFDEVRLLKRAEQEDVVDALESIQQIREAVIRQKLSKTQANLLLEKAAKVLKK
ncbi:MAG: hypothetical protein H7A32_02460 [Deltaproteobacteria bacterium]|nr:hypothetical protein [Deltaproteobacteria bacterium]